MERSGWRNRKLRDCSEFCVSHQQQYSFNLQDEANERVLYPSFYRMWRFLQFGNDCRSIVSGVHHGIRSLSKMAALPSTAQDDCRASRCRQSTKGKLILHTTVNKKSKSIFLELFFLLQSMALNAIHALLSDLQGESNPPVGIACQTQWSAVELHDLPRKAQPDARAVGLGRVEGGKDIFGDLGRDRSPVVVELDDNSLRRGWTQASRRTILYRTQAPCENPVPRRKAMIVTRLRNDESNPMTDYFPAKAWALWLGDSPATRATYSPRYAYAANMPETAYLSEINDKYEYRGNLGKPRLVPWREQLQRVNHSESSYLWSRTDFGITTAPQATRQISASKRTPPKPRTSKLLSRESLLSWFTWGSPSSYSVIPVR